MALYHFRKEGSDAVSKFPSILQSDAVTARLFYTPKVYALQGRHRALVHHNAGLGGVLMTRQNFPNAKHLTKWQNEL